MYLYLLILAIAAASCSPKSPPREGEVELGTGGLAFETLEENQELLLIAGPQGGYHLIVHARMRGLIPGNPSMPGLLGNPITTFSLYDNEGRQIDAQYPPYRLGYRDEDSWLELPSGRILPVNQELVDSEGLVPAIYGTPLRLRVEIEDAAGDFGSDETWIVPVRDVRPDAGPFVDASIADAGAIDAM